MPKAVSYYDEGATPFDPFHAATAETRAVGVLSPERDDERIEVERVSLEPSGGE